MTMKTTLISDLRKARAINPRHLLLEMLNSKCIERSSIWMKTISKKRSKVIMKC